MIHEIKPLTNVVKYYMFINMKQYKLNIHYFPYIRDLLHVPV